MRTLLLATSLAVLFFVGAAKAQKAEDYLISCPDDTVAECKADQASFRKWYPKALRGDYQGQRNVAFFLSGRSRGGGIIVNKITGCAWRMVIITSGSSEVWSGDTDNLKIECGKLDEVERQAAAAQATAISAKIVTRGRNSHR